MKKTLFAMVAMASILLASCEKDFDMTNPSLPDATDGIRISLKLTDADSNTRASFEDTAAAAEWEKTLLSLSVFAFDNGGKLILRRDFTSAELTAKSASFSLPKSAAGTSCSFYAVANYDASSARSKAALLTLVENAAALYNGTYAEVSSGAKRAEGFVMSGSTSVTVGAVNSTTQVGITLKRTVAKIALQATVSPSFNEKYAGSLTVTSVKLSKAATQSAILSGAAPAPGPMTFTHTQTPGVASGKYDALFYTFENGALNAGNRVLLEINATYDMDADLATTDDRSEVTYSIELSGKGAGEIIRNGYYRITASITGLVGQDCIVSVSVADWETPITQTVELGA